MELSRAFDPRRRGFTLVEMLIVLGILVAMFAMVLPRFLGSQKKAKINQAETQIGAFRAALEHYYLDCDRFPTTEQGLSALVTKPADLAETVTWRGPYVSGDIGADPWGNPYQYEFPPTHGTGDTPDIWSYGPDGEDGTEDDVCSWTGGTPGSENAATGDRGQTAAKPAARSAKGSPKASTKSTSPRASAPKSTSTRATTPRPVRSDNP
jgi:general secretion pathway protein G